MSSKLNARLPKKKKLNARILICDALLLYNALKNWNTCLPPSSSSSGDEAVVEITSAEALQYNFGTIRVATDDFSDANKLGQGGFGAVYKVTLPADLIINLGGVKLLNLTTQ